MWRGTGSGRQDDGKSADSAREVAEQAKPRSEAKFGGEPRGGRSHTGRDPTRPWLDGVCLYRLLDLIYMG